jgi:hypothetical protein
LKFGPVVANGYKSHVVVNGMVTFWLISSSEKYVKKKWEYELDHNFQDVWVV